MRTNENAGVDEHSLYAKELETRRGLRVSKKEMDLGRREIKMAQREAIFISLPSGSPFRSSLVHCLFFAMSVRV
jgi:hypothetical protein